MAKKNEQQKLEALKRERARLEAEVERERLVLEERLMAKQAKLEDIKAKETAVEQVLQQRRAVIVGEAMLALLDSGVYGKAEFLARLDPLLKNKKDRGLFDFADPVEGLAI